MNDIYSTPKADLDMPPPQGYLLAERWRRLVASLLDGITVMPFTFGGMFLLGDLQNIKEGIPAPVSHQLIIAAVAVMAFSAIHGRMLVKAGQTWGKKVMRIKIVKVDETKADTKALVKRYAFYLLIAYLPWVGQYLSIAGVLFIFSKSRRCLHDYVGETKVVAVQ